MACSDFITGSLNQQYDTCLTPADSARSSNGAVPGAGRPTVDECGASSLTAYHRDHNAVAAALLAAHRDHFDRRRHGDRRAPRRCPASRAHARPRRPEPRLAGQPVGVGRPATPRPRTRRTSPPARCRSSSPSSAGSAPTPSSIPANRRPRRQRRRTRTPPVTRHDPDHDVPAVAIARIYLDAVRRNGASTSSPTTPRTGGSAASSTPAAWPGNVAAWPPPSATSPDPTTEYGAPS